MVRRVESSTTTSSRISRIIRSGARPLAPSTDCTRSTASAVDSSLADRFTATRTGSWSGRALTSANRVAASSSVRSPIGPRRPMASASSRKWSGVRRPSTGWRQRRSASAPMSRPDDRSTTGW